MGQDDGFTEGLAEFGLEIVDGFARQRPDPQPTTPPDADSLVLLTDAERVAELRAELYRLVPGEPLKWGALPGICRQCGGACEEVRSCWAVPTCHKCLPPPPPMETIPYPDGGT